MLWAIWVLACCYHMQSAHMLIPYFQPTINAHERLKLFKYLARSTKYTRWHGFTDLRVPAWGGCRSRPVGCLRSWWTLWCYLFRSAQGWRSKEDLTSSEWDSKCTVTTAKKYERTLNMNHASKGTKNRDGGCFLCSLPGSSVEWATRSPLWVRKWKIWTGKCCRILQDDVFVTLKTRL